LYYYLCRIQLLLGQAPSRVPDVRNEPMIADRSLRQHEDLVKKEDHF
jgi:hypothetical protein